MFRSCFRSLFATLVLALLAAAQTVQLSHDRARMLVDAVCIVAAALRIQGARLRHQQRGGPAACGHIST